MVLLASCADDAALSASARFGLQVGNDSSSSNGSPLRWDDDNCGNPHVKCPDGGRCWEGICVPEGAANARLSSSAAAETHSTGNWVERALGIGPVALGGGRLDGVAVTQLAPDELREVLVGSTGGGVWRAFTEGVPDWVPSSTGLFDWNVVHVERDRSDPTRFWAVGWNLLFSRIEGGEWEYAYGFINARALPVFGSLEAIRPPSHPRPFAQAVVPDSGHFVLWSPPCEGLAVSMNGGQFDLQLIMPGDANSFDNCLTNIVVDPISHFVYVATMHPAWNPVDHEDRMTGEHAHVFRSAGPLGGPLAPFELANAGLPIRQIVAAMTSVSSVGTGADRLVAVVREGVTPASTYVTSDGATWVPALATGANSQPDELAFLGSGSDVVLGARYPQHSPDPFSSMWTEFANREVGWAEDVRGMLVDHETGPATLWAGNDFGQVGRWSWAGGSAPMGPTIIQPDHLNPRDHLG